MSSNASTRRVRSRGLARWKRSSGRSKAAPTDRRGLSDEPTFWNTICACLRNGPSAWDGNRATSAPSNSILPPLCRNSWSSRRPRVDLPQPLSPTRPNTSPGEIENETSFTAGSRGARRYSCGRPPETDSPPAGREREGAVFPARTAGPPPVQLWPAAGDRQPPRGQPRACIEGLVEAGHVNQRIAAVECRLGGGRDVLTRPRPQGIR